MVKSSPANAGDTRNVGLIPGSATSPEVGNGNLLHYSCLENPMDRGARWATVHGLAKSWTLLSTHTHTQSPPTNFREGKGLIFVVCGCVANTTQQKY